MLFEVDTLLLVGAGIISIVALAFAVRPYVIRGKTARGTQSPENPSATT